jgi:prepilin-type N-terminal cleavage/methylation domain-containing protein
MKKYTTVACSKQAGFTLIERLVVIAIIAILAAILFPFLPERAKTRVAHRVRATSSKSGWAFCNTHRITMSVFRIA